MTKYILSFVGALVIAAAIYGAYQYPQVPQILGTTSQGGQSSTANYYSVAANLASPGANATSSSILNTSTNDRYVSSIKTGCGNVGSSKTAYTGAGLAALTLSVATSSTAAPATNGNTNYVGGGSITIGTSTAQFAISTSTIGASVGSNAAYIMWKAGSYMTFTFNATNTAACTVGVEAFSS